jgi:tRNA (mo5U34)-methyltransferase
MPRGNPNGAPLSAEEILAQVDRLPRWRHRIPLGQGIVTPGREDSAIELTRIALPTDLSGLQVLDIGCSDGFFCFECEKRGAARIVGIENFTSTPGYQGHSGFDIAAGILSSNARLVEQSVYDLTPDGVGTFDIILFLNVLYHLQHPLLALERIRSVLKPDGALLLKTYFHQDLRFKRWGIDLSTRPMMRFFPAAELNDDPSNWWAPNRRCLEGMLRSAGFHLHTHLGTWGDRIYYRCTGTR